MEYIVKASELYEKAKEMLNDGMDYVAVSLMEPDDELPAAVHFEAWKKKEAFMHIDYEEVDVIAADTTE